MYQVRFIKDEEEVVLCYSVTGYGGHHAGSKIKALDFTVCCVSINVFIQFVVLLICRLFTNMVDIFVLNNRILFGLALKKVDCLLQPSFILVRTRIFVHLSLSLS